MELLLLCVALVAATSCPKETFWRQAKCFGSVGRGFSAVHEVDDACCACPQPSQLKLDDAGRCYHKTKWLRRRVYVRTSCCAGTHYQARGAREAVRTEDDPVKQAFNAVNGPGFFSEPAPPSNLEDEAISTRGLLQTQEMCARTRVNIRAGASTSSAVLGTVAQGQRIQVLGRSGIFFRHSGGFSAAEYFETCNGAAASASAPLPIAPPRAPVAPAPHSNGICPAFFKVWQGYPSQHEVPSPELLPQLGFGDWVTNTCAIRTTLGLRNYGIEPGEVARSKWVAKGKRYLIRVAEMGPFLDATFGKPYVTGGPGVPTGQTDGEGNQIFAHPENFKGKAGIIHYWNCGWSDATGHFDVWDGTQIRSHGYPDKCQNMALYDVCTPLPNPDYSAFVAYMKRTNAA